YQVSCTAYDAVGGDDRRHLLARLMQFFTPGIPQVFYVGLLAGHNDPTATGDAREINRRRYSAGELAAALRQPVVVALGRLIRFRNAHPAFGGECTLPDAPAGELAMAWRAGADRAEVWTRPGDAACRITFSTAAGGLRTVTDPAELPY
ncbi:MAG TPA: sucrose phosphorylase, partial [Mycobacteriales bacterium]|nr:sucrose phosphorylase [Mycobacteriales bacterium]